MSIRKTVCRLGIVLAVAGAVGLLGCENSGKNNPVGGGGGDGGGGGTAVMTDSTVTINGLTWMRANLDIETPDSWCYENDPSNCVIYGRLYTWEAANSACVSMYGGWRLPTNADWNVLVTYAGDIGSAGEKLKSKSGWPEDVNGTDDYGFSALPGGYRIRGSFDDIGRNGTWWSATEDGSDGAYYRFIDYKDGYVNVREYSLDKGNLFSVRCVTN